MIRLRLLKLNLKNFIKTTPIAILGIIIPLLIIGILFLFTSNNLYNKIQYAKAPVGVVTEDIENDLYKKVTSYLDEMDSTKDATSYIKYDSLIDANRALKSGNIMAILYIPEEIINDINTFNSGICEISFSNNVTINTLIFSELTNSAAKFLSAAQASILAYAEICDNKENIELYNKSIDLLNFTNISKVLVRQSIFITKEINSTENFSSKSFYICSGIIIILLFFGVSFSKVLRNENQAFTDLLKANKVSLYYKTLCKFICFTFILFVILSSAFSISAIILKYFVKANYAFNINPVMFLALLCICMFIASLNVFVFQISDRPFVPILLIFLITVIMSFISGLIIPKIFLPNQIANIGDKLPTSYMHRLVLLLVNNAQIEYTSILWLIIYSVILLIITNLITQINYRRKNH